MKKNTLQTIGVFLLLFQGISNCAAADYETILLKDIYPGSNSSYPNHLTAVNNEIFFSASDGNTGQELWKTDGTEIGTELVRDIRLGNSSALAHLTNFNGSLIFSARDGQKGQELWKSDGTFFGTQLIKDIYPGGNTSSPDEFTLANEALFFSAREDDNLDGLWKTDGTNKGTKLVSLLEAPVEQLTYLDGMLFFRGFDNQHGRELWLSDGTGEGTALLKDINRGNSFSQLDNLTAVEDLLFFTADNSNQGKELWKSDGTERGTVLVKDIRVGRSGSSPKHLIAFQGLVYFSANDGNGDQLWKSDGTLEGTVKVNSNSTQPSNFKVVGDSLYFFAFDPEHGEELWKTNGTESGTVLVKDIYPGNQGSNPSPASNSEMDAVILQNVLIFSANNAINGTEIWVSDGSPEGTFMFEDIQFGIQGSNPTFLTEVNGSVYFMADDGIHGNELWTIRSTSLVKQSSYQFESTLLTIPAVQVGDIQYQVTLRLLDQPTDAFHFQLETVILTNTPISQYTAIYSLQDNRVTIPAVQLFESGQLIGVVNAELQWLEGTDPMQFKLIAVENVN